MELLFKFAAPIICLVGLFLYLWSPNPKAANVGDRMFWVGLLVTLMKF